MFKSFPLKYLLTLASFHPSGKSGSIINPFQSGFKPKIPSTPTIKYHAAEPVYQVHPPLPKYGESGPSTFPGVT